MTLKTLSFGILQYHLVLFNQQVSFSIVFTSFICCMIKHLLTFKSSLLKKIFFKKEFTFMTIIYTSNR